jgi:tyrosine-specific transport protein
MRVPINKAKGFEIAALVAAATVGDGMFALPYLFFQAGWLVCLIYFAVLSCLIALAHSVYLETLEKGGEKKRLLGLARTYFGSGGFWTGFIAIVVGLLLTLVAYLLLGTEFIALVLPNVPSRVAFLGFWALLSIPVFLDGRHARELEFVGIFATVSVVLLIFFSSFSQSAVAFASISAVHWKNIFLPFGTVLFSLAGWTSVESVYEATHKGMGAENSAKHARMCAWKGIFAGTLFAAFVYALFSAGIIGSVAHVTSDTVSGLMAWALWKRELIGIMGLVAVGTVYIPISREIKNALERDLGWSKIVSRIIIIGVPPLLIALGMNSFLGVVEIVGGIFLSAQYLLIISVGRRALSPRPVKKFFLDLAAAVFIIAAVYEVASFVVH